MAVYFVNNLTVDRWERLLGQLELNWYQGKALQGFYESCRELMWRRDEVDAFRMLTTVHVYDRDQTTLHRTTKAYFDTYYTALSYLSGVIARFQTVFIGNFTENAPLLKWAATRYPEVGLKDHDLLEEARLFRALLSHPQQFSVMDWASADYLDVDNFRIVLHGPSGRGKNPIPPGARTEGTVLRATSDWAFEAPADYRVTNAFFVLAEEVIADLYSKLAPRSSFKPDVTIAAARELLIPPLDEMKSENRRVESTMRSTTAVPLPPDRYIAHPRPTTNEKTGRN